MQPVIPTLGVRTMITDPEDQLRYILNFFAAAPRDATDTYRSLGLTISIVDIMSRYSYRKADIVDPITTELKNCLIRIYGNNNAVVKVTTEDIDEVRYAVVISATVFVDGVPYTVSPNVRVNNGRLEFQ